MVKFLKCYANLNHSEANFIEIMDVWIYFRNESRLIEMFISRGVWYKPNIKYCHVIGSTAGVSPLWPSVGAREALLREAQINALKSFDTV